MGHPSQSVGLHRGEEPGQLPEARPQPNPKFQGRLKQIGLGVIIHEELSVDSVIKMSRASLAVHSEHCEGSSMSRNWVSNI